MDDATKQIEQKVRDRASEVAGFITELKTELGKLKGKNFEDKQLNQLLALPLFKIKDKNFIAPAILDELITVYNFLKESQKTTSLIESKVSDLKDQIESTQNELVEQSKEIVKHSDDFSNLLKIKWDYYVFIFSIVLGIAFLTLSFFDVLNEELKFLLFIPGLILMIFPFTAYAILRLREKS